MSKLNDAYPSPPGRPGRYCLYLSRHGDDDTQCMVVIFCETYAARKFLDILLKDDGIIWDDAAYLETSCKKGSTIRSETGIVVSTRWYPKRMRECVEHELTLQEIAWDLSPQYVKWARQFRNGPDLPRTLDEDTTVKAKRERASSAPKKAAPPGWVHVSDVAMSMNIDPRDARRVLRGIMSKPDVGWWFDPKTIDGLKAQIKKAMEE